MARFLIWIGFITIGITVTHGFIWPQSIVHGLILHPIFVLFGLILIGFGASIRRF
jgi:hypothetical protein